MPLIVKKNPTIKATVSTALSGLAISMIPTIIERISTISFNQKRPLLIFFTVGSANKSDIELARNYIAKTTGMASTLICQLIKINIPSTMLMIPTKINIPYLVPSFLSFIAE